MNLQISIREYGDVRILDLHGRLTIGRESESLGTQLRDLITQRVRKLLLNLANLTKIDSSGVSLIVDAHVALKRIGGRLELLAPSGQVLDVLTVFHLRNLIPSFENETQALANFRSRGCSAIA